MPLKLHGIKIRLFGIVLLSMLPVLCIALFMTLDDYRLAKRSAVESSRNLTHGYAASCLALIERSRLLLQQAADKPGAQDLDSAACRQIASHLKARLPSTHRFSIFQADGAPVCSSRLMDAHQPSARFRDWFGEVLRSKAFTVGRFQQDPADGTAVLPLALPVLRAQGDVRQVLCLWIALDSLADILDEQPLPEGAAASIIDKDGTILARFPRAEGAVGNSAPGVGDFLPEVQGKGLDTWESEGVDGVRRIYFLSPIAGAGDFALLLRVGMPANVVFAPANAALKRNLGFIGAMAALAFFSTWFFSNAMVLRHTKKLWLATRKLSEGNYSYRIGATGGGELGELALAFDHMAGVLEDRTARLSHAESKYRGIFENSVAGIFQVTPEGRFTSANQALARLLGYKDSQELICTVQDVGRDVYLEPGRRSQVLERLNREGTVSGVEFPAKGADGSVVWLSMDARAVRSTLGHVEHYEGMVADITLRKRMELELAAKQEKLQALLDHSPALISIKDAEGRYLLTNRRHQEMSSQRLPVVGRKVEELFPAVVAQRILEEDATVLAEGRAITFQNPLADDTGVRHFVTVKFPLKDESGRPSRVGSISHDVTDLERAREALRQSEEKFRTMIQTSPDLIWYIDPQGVLLEVNNASRELIGYEPEELRGKHFHLFFFPEDLREHDREQVLPQLLGRVLPRGSQLKLINERRQLARSTRNLNLRLVPKGGLPADTEPRNFELSACGLWQEMRFMGTIVVIRDITERRRAEAALRQSQDLLNQTQAMARIVGWTMDLDTRTSSWTEQAEAMLGVEGAELRELLASGDFLAPEDREVFRAALAEAEILGEPFDLELRRAKNGGPQAWVRIMGSRTNAGNARLLSCALQDITERKQLEQLRADIESIIRHDLKAPLNGIINLPQLMKNDANLTESQVESLQFVEDCGRNMLRQVEMSLDLMKIERGQYVSTPTACDLVPILRDILGVLGDSARIKRVGVEVSLDGQPLASGSEFLVWGEARLCYPLLTNLIVNALEASPGGGSVRVDLAQGQWSQISISNAGEVPASIREQFFEKYATAGKTAGTGLGTYSALLFAKAQNGGVELDSSEPGATSITVRLPRFQGQA